MAYPGYYNFLPILIGCTIYLLSRRHADANFLEKRLTIHSGGLNTKDILTLNLQKDVVQQLRSTVLGLKSNQAVSNITPTQADIAKAVKRRFSIEAHVTAISDELIGLGFTKYWSIDTYNLDRIAQHFYLICLNIGGLKIHALMSPREFLAANKIVDSSTIAQKAVLSLIRTPTHLSVACSSLLFPSFNRMITNYSKTSAFLLTMYLIGKIEVVLYP